MKPTKLLRILDLSTYIAFDFETTGLSPENDRIIEIAAIKFEGGHAVDRLVTLVNPERPIDSFITDITGITNGMVADAPVEVNIIDDFLEFLEDFPLIAHNISFDISFLKALCMRYDRNVVEHILYDTLQLSRTFLYFLPMHSLGSISEFFNLSAIGSHRAEKDTENTGIIFQRLVQEAASYPMEVISKILALSKKRNVPNKSLYINIGNVLKKEGNLKTGIVDSDVKKPISGNVFEKQGQGDISTLTVNDVFGIDGRLSQVMANFEERPTQKEYGQFVTDMLGEEQSYCAIEAGTGLGKSLAYLFPAIQKAFSVNNNYPVVISCYTKHLQDQLFQKDLPLLAESLDVSLHALLLKGRSNYLCLTRFNWLIADANRLLNVNEVESLYPVIVWLHHTQTGDLSECAGFWNARSYRVADLIQSESGFCTTSLCQTHDGCFFGPIRQAVHKSQVIIVNHALLLSNMNTPGLLPPFESVIVDEAHNLVDAAYDQLSHQVTPFQVQAILDIIDPDGPNAVRWTKKLEQLCEDHTDLKIFYQSLERECERSRNAGKEFFENLVNVIRMGIKDDIPYPQHIILENLAEGYGAVLPQAQEFEMSMNTVSDALHGLHGMLIEMDPGREELAELIQLFEYGADAIKTLLITFTALTREQQNGWVYWQKGQYRQSRSGKELNISINGAPVDIAEDLSKSFFESVGQCLLTSATLRVEESFEYYLNRTGIDRLDQESVHTAEFRSPFYYEDQVRYFQYSGSNGQSPELIADVIYTCHQYYGKRIMGLFTSRQALNQVYRELQKKPGGRKLPIYAQVSGTSRYALLKGMHRSSNGILLGTNAFWEGVDLPMDLLEILIIAKLPFSVPSEPRIRAYSNMLQQQGRNPFMEFNIPEAVVRFRQGFGRLIRTIEDEGMFICMDDRIVNKRYGSAFSDAIPVRMQLFFNSEELLK